MSNDNALARATDPATSHAAAAKIDVTATEAIVLAALRERPAGLTSHEIANATGRDLVSISPRMKPLTIKGKVIPDGKRNGRTVWRLAA